ncbi:hypothetical protein M427DRAFT_52599 [Gonapodya prolifera JEL478]|uniref:Vps53 N-terminal domain-containing protein n=1 Tax=Gonapodya prolifera (strain JEL478) TaxID=1344416 RepID=A0A139ASJ7_GONPJ|nr:hypothetical protein M427DRAFT_52599 [Gonapodya prolifera JEL478]|eukprot:KXS19711.1 hypothetical protein M427DRAFT_52599 [Gonapodya prolifera JEL478]
MSATATAPPNPALPPSNPSAALLTPSTPELDAALAAILDSDDPLDSEKFDPLLYINALFPDAQSLSALPVVLTRLKRHLRSIDQASRELVRAQTDAGEAAAKEIERVRGSVETLRGRVDHFRSSAVHTRALVADIAGDMAHLDRAKRNLAHAVAVLRRGQMMATALAQLSHLLHHRRYAPCAALLSAVLALGAHFSTYSRVPEFARMVAKCEDVQKEARTKVVEEFTAAFSAQPGVRPPLTSLRDACELVDAMERAGEVRKQVLDIYCESQLKEYRSLFRGNDEIAALDNTSRRYAWLKRLLRLHDAEHAGAFPPTWRASDVLCERFCDDTRTDLAGVLSRQGERLDVKGMLGVLKETIEFEGWLARRSQDGRKAKTGGVEGQEGVEGAEGQADTDAGVALESTPTSVTVTTPVGGTAAPGSQFRRRISSAFEPYLSHYIAAEDASVSSLVDTYRNKPVSEDDVAMGVLTSSTELFLYYRNALVHCAKMSTGKTLVDLSKMFAKWLGHYAEILAGRLQKDEKKPLSPEDLSVSCLVVNTADYCYTTISQLEERLKDKADPELKEEIKLDSEREKFLNVAATAIRALVRGVENSVEPGFTAMVKIPWASLDVVGDQNAYVVTIAAGVRELVSSIRQAIANGRYYRSFCDKFAESLLNKYANNIYRCKPISEVGAEQMLLDTHAIKSTLTQLPNMGSDTPSTPPTTYVKLVAKGVSRVETLLKIVMTPNEPLEGFLENYLLLSSQDSNLANFQRVLELKGLKRTDQQLLTDMFLRRTSPGGQNLPPGPLGTPIGVARTGTPAPTAGSVNAITGLPGISLGGTKVAMGTDFGFKRLMGMVSNDSPPPTVPAVGANGVAAASSSAATFAGTFAKLQTGWKATTGTGDDGRGAAVGAQPPPLPAAEKPKVDLNTAFQKMWTNQK